MTDVEHTTSESEEMYLITVARVTEEGTDSPVPVAVLAKHLQVSVASVNEMVRKLAARDLVEYEPYRGVDLTPAGAVVAERVLRTRRLWATFLADHLGFSPGEADDQACLLEHVTMPEATDRLAGFLGDPSTGPLGRPIPPSVTAARPSRSSRLSDLGVGSVAEIVAVSGSRQAIAFLDAEGITPGARVTVAAVGEAGLLLDVDQRQINVSAELARTVDVNVKG